MGGAAGGATGTGGLFDRGTALAGWALTWSDEFNGADGTAVDASKWVNETGGNGWETTSSGGASPARRTRARRFLRR